MLFKSRFQGSRRGRSPRRSRRFIPLALERLEPYLLMSVGDYIYSFTITSNLGPETQGTGQKNAYRIHSLFLPLGGAIRIFTSFETTWSIARSFSGSLTVTDVGTPDGPGLASATIPFSGSLSKNGPLSPSGVEVYQGSVPLTLAPVYEVLHGVSYEVSEFVYNYQWSIAPPDNSSNIYIATLLDNVSVVVGAQVGTIEPTALSFDSDGNLDYGYTISGADLPQATTVALYWAKGTTTDTEIGPAIVTTTTETAQGTYPLQAPASDLADRPAGAEYLLAVADPDNSISPASPSKVAALALPDVTATDMTFGSGGGVDYGYQVTGADLPQATTVDLYWASGTTTDDEIGDPIVTTTTQTAQGTYPLQAPASDLADRPAGAKYLLAVADPDNSISPADPSKVAAVGVFEVTSLDDSADGSLRDVIDAVNTDPIDNGTDQIYFAGDIAGGTISLRSPLPPLTRDQVTLTGPATLDGTASQGDGLDVSGNEDTVQNLTITGFPGAGIAITGNQDTVTASQVTDNQDGIDISGGASNNTVGGVAGSNLADAISGNHGDGVRIEGDKTSGNLIIGNSIGVDADGTADGNGDVGVLIDDGASNNMIGDYSAGNLISGNVDEGVDIEGDGTSSNVVAWNTIGLAADGTADGNGGDGVYLGDGASANTIGGDAGAGNVISTNLNEGIHVSGDETDGNLIEGNEIGTDVYGQQALGNQIDGILIDDGASDNTVGGTATSAGNLIYANQGNGLELDGATETLVIGNTIGAAGTGDSSLGNGASGVILRGAASDNTIGGTVGAGGNLISANGGAGISIEDPGTSSNLIVGNDVQGNGTPMSGNPADGIFIGGGASNNTIGGSWGVTGNTISGNVRDGVNIDGDGTDENLIIGNEIGLSQVGVVDANGRDGIFLGDGASANTIGGGGASPDSRNVISGNASDGVHIEGPDTSGELVLGNAIGTDFQGGGSYGNGASGITVIDASDNTIGGTSTFAANVISSNGGNGIDLDGASSTLVVGNSDTDNSKAGILIEGGATDSTIGGTADAAANVISTNLDDGLRIQGAGTDDNLVEGNDIGTDSGGSQPLGLQPDGVLIGDGATSNTIGGTTAGASNIIMGNTGDGVHIQDPGTDDNLIVGNGIGVGTFAWGNGGNGVSIGGGASGNTIGGTISAAANQIARNTGDGVHLEGSDTSGNVVEGNVIGTDSLGRSFEGNEGAGVYIGDKASGNIIGGTVAAAANVITYNGTDNTNLTGHDGYGVVIDGDGTVGNFVGDNDIGPDIPPLSQGGNAKAGVLISGGASGNLVGYNVISGNGGAGVEISGLDASGNPGFDTSGNRVFDNTIGLDPTFQFSDPNSTAGVLIDNGASDNTIGGSSTASANAIAGNTHGAGVEIIGAQTSGNVVAANYIGTTDAGAKGFGNGNGVVIAQGATDNTVGGTTQGAGNIIAYNAGSGVAVGLNVHDAALEDAVEENSIFSNGGLGIDLGSKGVIPNNRRRPAQHHAPVQHGGAPRSAVRVHVCGGLDGPGGGHQSRLPGGGVP